MSNNIQVKVHPSLINVFGKIGKSFADDIKRKYHLTELFVPNTLASQILAGMHSGKKEFNFRVRKTSINKGVLELVN